MRQPDALPAAPALSVVVIGRNEGQRLARCLDSIRALRGVEGEIEVIYADSGSTDGSVQLAAAAGARVAELHPERPTAALGRNAGWTMARSAYILFLDGDTILHPDFVRHAMEAISADPKIAAVWGHRREIHPEKSVYNRILDLDWVFAPGVTDYCGGDVLMRREALEAVGGYDATLIAGEEPELCRRMRTKGYSILHTDTPMTGHDLAMTRFSQYWKRALRAGHAYAEVSRRFRNTPDPLWQPQRRKNFLRGGFWAISLLSAIAASILWRSFLPVAVWTGLLLILSMRSAWHARWKSASPLTLLLYGIHSHLQQIPIGIGQLQFDLNARQGRRQKLIEYKENA
ncbi:glycosyltransferase [Paracidobacterium acidisoli]|uniref:Glycosyltransferase n=1 Tax=Paracidobacterium acidisoli TaxID=2303751 RepID=A0A372IT20_9BACT|nr:glycosyltransferase [Paracidobacterium acidisoli]MBT9330263.1 glycosyltransferase [Paracidobacterium acidisoli]